MPLYTQLTYRIADSRFAGYRLPAVYVTRLWLRCGLLHCPTLHTPFTGYPHVLYAFCRLRLVTVRTVAQFTCSCHYMRSAAVGSFCCGCVCTPTFTPLVTVTCMPRLRRVLHTPHAFGCLPVARLRFTFTTGLLYLRLLPLHTFTFVLTVYATTVTCCTFAARSRYHTYVLPHRYHGSAHAILRSTHLDHFLRGLPRTVRTARLRYVHCSTGSATPTTTGFYTPTTVALVRHPCSSFGSFAV